MRLVIQRVMSAKVSVNDEVVGRIGKGLFVLFGAGKGDKVKDAELMAEKLSKMRIMADAKNKMNLSVSDTDSSVLVVSQFTLLADTMGGNRPSFINAMNPEEAEKLYNHFVGYLKDKRIHIETGSFGDYMKIEVLLDGPVTIILNSKELK